MALIETNFIRPQEVYDRNTGKSKVRYRSYDGNDRFIPVMEGENGVPKTLVEVTHAELKAMRDAGKLIPGALYRITDYNCTTTQENTRSAGHQFDIVLLALSENKLAEEGWAMMHENDTYFANSNLSSWKVWYCLDNDTARFAWADDSVDEGTGLPNGRGVIYRLIDEWNNDVAYDFKNIQLYLPIVDGGYVEDGQKTWVYTFCLYNSDEGTYEDGSLKIIEVSVDDTYVVFNNIFMTANFAASGRYSIAFNVALGYYSLSDEDGDVPSNCIYESCFWATIIKSNTFLYYCRERDFVAQIGGVYFATKKVLTEE